MLNIGLIINLFLVVGALFALWKGGRAERFAAAIVIANALIGEAFVRLGLEAQDALRLVNDAAAAVALLVVTIRYGAPWMGAMMFFFAAQFALFSFYMVTERPHDGFKALVNNLDWSAITWCLIIGTALSWRSRARQAAEPALEAAP